MLNLAEGVNKLTGSIASMDEMSQQNSALVEESSAAARALSDQADKLAELKTFFKLDRAVASVREKTATTRSAQVHAKPKARQTAVNVPALASASDDDWSEF